MKFTSTHGGKNGHRKNGSRSRVNSPSARSQSREDRHGKIRRGDPPERCKRKAGRLRLVHKKDDAWRPHLWMGALLFLNKQPLRLFFKTELLSEECAEQHAASYDTNKIFLLINNRYTMDVPGKHKPAKSHKIHIRCRG